jgi:hypothetical protein
LSGEILEATAVESRAVAVADVVVPGSANKHGHGGVATLLTVAAVVAAVIGFRAAVVSSSASSSWQSALRTEVKRSAAAMEDVRTLYEAELPVALRILEARTFQAELLAAAQQQSGPARAALVMEANVQSQVITALSPSSGLATSASYAGSTGGFDLGKALADLRAQSPDLVSLNPDKLESNGDELAHKAQLLTLALIPTSFSALLGVLAQPLKRRRTLLLRLGAVALGAGAIMALAVELTA